MQLQVKRASNVKDNNQAYWYAMGAEQFARKSIAQVMDLDDGVVHINQPWSQEFTYPLEGGGIQASLVDMQSCFNLNALKESPDNQNASENKIHVAFYEMLRKADLEIPDFNAETLRDSLADWLDEDDNLRSYGAEDSDYESLQFPYVAANNLMVSKSELRLINGVEQAWIQDVMPLVCVLPGNDALRINVNTLTEDQAPILAGLIDLSLEDARGLIGNRPSDGYESAEDFLAEPEVGEKNLDDDQRAWFVTTTEYFILHTRTRYNNASFAMSSLFYAPEGAEIRVIRREFGGKM